MKTTTYQYGNIEIVVHRPLLNAKEQAKREEALKRAVMAYGKETMKRKG